MVEQNRSQDNPTNQEIVILVESQPDHGCSMMCCGNRTIQQQVDYRLSFQEQRYSFPGIWAAVCESQPDHIFFDPKLGESLLNVIYRYQELKNITPERRRYLPEDNI